MIDDHGNSQATRRTALLIAVACLILPVLAAADAPMRQRAGEWVSQIGNGQVHRVCLHQDRVLDQASLLGQFTKIPNTKCTINEMHMGSPVTSYMATCVIAGSMKMVVHETVTMTAADTVQTKGTMQSGNDKAPTTVNSLTSHRTGPCQPGDRDI